MCEETLARFDVKGRERVPEVLRLRRELLRPVEMTRVDLGRERRIREPRRLRAETNILRFDLEAGVGAVAIEEPQTHGVKRREEGDVRVIAERLAQRQRAIGGELGQQFVGQRPNAFVFLVFRWARSNSVIAIGCVGMRHDGRSRTRASGFFDLASGD